MKKNLLALALQSFPLIILPPALVWAQHTSGFSGLRTEQMSLYGYILHNLNLTQEDVGNVFYFRLKGDWNPVQTSSSIWNWQMITARETSTPLIYQIYCQERQMKPRLTFPRN